MATTRSTSGTGYDFEDQVAAWLLLAMLRGAPVPLLELQAAQLQWQTGTSIDDLEAVAMPASGTGRVLALSCKSNVQVTANGFPVDFLDAAWQRWRTSAPSPAPVLVALATRDSHRDFNAAWKDIKDWCREGPSAAVARIAASKKHTRIFSGIAEAARRHEPGVSSDSIIAFVQGIGVLPLDFQLEPSQREADAITHCRDLLVNGQLQEARDLWDGLLTLAKTKRLAGGTIDLTELIDELRPCHALKQHPDFAPSWAVIGEISTERIVAVETALPSGFAVDRAAAVNRVVASLSRSSLTLVHGESGAGKSALVLSALRASGAYNVVWLRATDLERLMAVTERASLRVAHPLPDLLRATTSPTNVLVIDSAERLTDDGVKHLVELLTSSQRRQGAPGNSTWRFVVVAQSVGLDALEPLRPSIAIDDAIIEVSGIAPPDVRRALRSVEGLAWLASDGAAVEALRNLKALAWVAQAPNSFKQDGFSGVSSRTGIADRLWRHWTGDKLVLQQIMITMAEREANFGPAVALRELDAAQLSAIEQMPPACPIATQHGRLEFRHDLASDWSRYRHLRQLPDDPTAWAAYASNPLWHTALRMLGQQLLRERSGDRCKWDQALEQLEQTKGPSRSGADLLLDALSLDPQADRWLDERTELLFADQAKRLQRMLERFHHVATVPALSASSVGRGLGFYIEATFRTPIFGQWGPVVRFLHNNLARIAPLGSPAVAKLCETWLKSTPIVLSAGTPTYFRRELAGIAVAAARELQLQLAQHWIVHGKGTEAIYAAAFAAAPDLPDDVTAWALEMARRRPLRQDISDRKTAYHQEQARLHAERMKSETDYRQRHEQARRATGIGFPGPRKLPPWPLGAKGRVDNEFQRSCCHRGVLAQMMKVRPAEAAEILLAVIIDDQPEEERSDGLEDNLGLACDRDGDPPAYWKSPFYAFLHANPDVALPTLLKLVDFCTERWRAVAERRAGRSAPGIEVKLSADASRRLYGNTRVFSWAWDRSLRSGQLTSALAALERWLWERCEAGQDVGPTIDTILRGTFSVAILGVLVNVGKAHPRLFAGPLAPLLAVVEVYFWDHQERDALRYRFDAFSWWRAGEQVYELAKQWILAPFRSTDLVAISLERQRADAALAAQIHSALQACLAAQPDLDAEPAAFIATLDCANYERLDDGTYAFKQRPASLPTEVAATPSERDRLLSANYLAWYTLRQQGILSEAFAVEAVAMLDTIERTDLLNAMEKRGNATALATLLLVKADDWVAERPELAARCVGLVRSTLEEPDSDQPLGRRLRLGALSPLDFAGTAIVARWLRSPDDPDWAALIVELMTNPSEGAVAMVVNAAFPHREALGDRWFRLLEIAALWAALLALKPRHDDSANERIWAMWRSRLRCLKLNVASSFDRALRLANLARCVERLHRSRFRRRRTGRRVSDSDPPKHHLSWGLDTRVLAEAFGWALNQDWESKEPIQPHGRDVARAIWEFETWRVYSIAERDRGLPCQLGYDALFTLGRAAVGAAPDEARRCWMPVLSLGGRGEAAACQFANAFFSRFAEHPEPERVAQIWRSMIDFALTNDNLTSGGPWYDGEKLLHRLLGFGSEATIGQLPGAVSIVTAMRDLYARWAAAHLARDDDNLTHYAHFLTKPIAVGLRAEGIEQIAQSLTQDAVSRFIRRDRAGNCLVELIEVALSEPPADADGQLQSAILSITDLLVQRGVPAALALQDRIRRLKR